MPDDNYESFNSLFLGPKGENAAFMIELLTEIVTSHATRRRSFQQDDGFFIQPADQGQLAYHRKRSLLREWTAKILQQLEDSIPWWSPRYMAHMNTDVLLPAIVGYIATMIDNPNNVVIESSPPSSHMEVEAIDEMLDLVGFQPRHSRTPGSIAGWGHFTSGGTIANFEALWVARNIKYFPMALRKVAEYAAANIEITLPSGRRRLLFQKTDPGGRAARAQDEWELLNLTYAEALSMREKLIEAIAPPGSSEQDMRTAERLVDEGFFRKRGVSAEGLWGNWSGEKPGIVLVSGTTHYSPMKAVEVLGIGRRQLYILPPDSSFRMDIKALRDKLLECVDERQPVIAIIAVVGTTEEATIDPVHEICDLRDELAQEEEFWFPIHVDAAYGGYIRTLFRGIDGQPLSRYHVMQEIGYNWPPEDIYRAQGAIARAESVTMDPHKKGYVPYPCGAILFADERVRDAVSSTAPYLWHGDKETQEDIFLGPYTLEGTRPGAASAAAWLAQKVLPLHAEGHGELIAGSVRNAQELYRTLREINPIVVGDHKVQVLPITQPDFSIVCFLLNIVGNEHLDEMNELISEVCERFAPYKPKGHKYYGRNDYFISKTTFDYQNYGESLCPLLYQQAGIHPAYYNDESEESRVDVIRMTMMHPWSLVRTEGTQFNYIQGFCETLHDFLNEFVPRLVAKRSERGDR
jgi:glutamate/tyrosine decarboxylase-like PLP-dependent enzyme